MEIKQNPFSFYDFLGYLIPGSIFLYSVLLMVGHALPGETALGFVTAKLSFDKAEIYIPFILLAYTIGHFLNFISSITIERYSVWAHGYPSKYLLGVQTKGYLDIQQKKALRTIMRILVFFMLAPLSTLDWLVGNKAGLRDLYAKPLDKLLIRVLRQKIECLIDRHAQVTDLTSHGTANESDFFRYVYHYAVENAQNHVPKMQNYVALYGFLRTLTLISLLLFWVIVWHLFASEMSFSIGALAMSMAALVTYILFMGFVKFYRRFSLEALMAMAVTFRCEASHSKQTSRA